MKVAKVFWEIVSPVKMQPVYGKLMKWTDSEAGGKTWLWKVKVTKS